MANSKVNSNSYKVVLDKQNKLKGSINTDEFELVIKSENDNNYCIVKDGIEYDVDVISTNRIKKSITILVNGKTFEVQTEDKYDALVKKLGFRNKIINSEKIIKTQMPGLILDIHVTEGENVIKGQKLITLEAMKMENIIKASSDYTIKKTKIIKGDTVDKNDVLFEID